MSRLVALTGATGFVGKALLKTLIVQGWHIKALSRNGNNPENEHVTWIKGDLHDHSALQELVRDSFAIIHCAGTVRGKNAAEFERSNVQGTVNLVQAAIENRQTSRFLLISSLAARFPEFSWYARSKFEAETWLGKQTGKLPCTIFRPTAIYGPGDREVKPMLNAMRVGFLTTPGNLDQRISLLHIDDLTSAISAWLQHTEAITGTYELDDGFTGGYRWEDLMDISAQVWKRRIYRLAIPIPFLKAFAKVNLGLSRLLHYSPMLTPGKINEITHSDWSCDNSALTRALGWKPRIKLQHAMREACLSPI